MSKLDEVRLKLAQTVEVGRQLGIKAKESGLSDDEKTEFSAIEAKVEEYKIEIKSLSDDEALDEKIARIGADVLGAPKQDEEVQTKNYKDPVAAFIDSDTFKEFVVRVKSGDRNASTAPVLFKSAVDVTGDPVGDLVTTYEPGIVRTDYTFPLSVGSLFSQGTMTGSNVSFLKSSSADADAAYQSSLGAQKGGTFALELDIDNEYAKTIAAVATIPAQNLDDIPALEGEIRNILLVGPNGLGEMLEDSYINGTGGSGDIQGILALNPSDSTIAGDYVSKSVFKAMADINAATGFSADAVVCSPATWFTLSTEVGTVDNRPLYGAWGSQFGTNGVGPRLVVSRKVADDTIIVGAFKAATRYVRQGISVSMDASGLGLRDKNLILAVCETREMVLHRYAGDPFRTVTVGSSSS